MSKKKKKFFFLGPANRTQGPANQTRGPARGPARRTPESGWPDPESGQADSGVSPVWPQARLVRLHRVEMLMKKNVEKFRKW